VKKLLGLFFLIPSLSACEFNYSGAVVSLSAPVTQYLVELDLLNSKKLKAVSSYHGINQDRYHGEVLGGGKFLSLKHFKKYREALIFYDQNREQELLFKKEFFQKAKIESFAQRGLDPFEVFQKLNKQIAPYLFGCEKKVQQLRKKVSKLKAEIDSNTKKPINALFFLGEIKGEKLPQYLVLNDGAISYLLKNKKLNSYPSDLAYVPWAAKIIKKMTGFKQIGLSTMKSKHFMKTLGKSKLNLYHEGALLPGISQIYFLQKLGQAWKKLRDV